MIIFIDNINLISAIKQSFINKDISIFNLSSYYSGFIDITDLCTAVPISNNTAMIPMDFVQSVEFDNQYSYYITNNTVLFTKLLMVISNSYEGNISIVLVQHDIYRDAIMESIIKLIQQRYGYMSWIINDIDDIPTLREIPPTPFGLEVLHNDLKTFDAINFREGDSISIE